MTIDNLTSTQAAREGLATTVRTLIAKQLGIDVQRVTEEAHLTYDLGAHWLDRLELMIMIEDRFVGVEITDDDFDQIDAVGDLICYIERVRSNAQLGDGSQIVASGVPGAVDASSREIVQRIA